MVQYRPKGISAVVHNYFGTLDLINMVMLLLNLRMDCYVFYVRLIPTNICATLQQRRRGNT